MTSQWDPDAGSKEEVLVGFVSGMGGGRGVACCDDQEVSFPSDVVTSISGYHPHVNDWVKVSHMSHVHPVSHVHHMSVTCRSSCCIKMAWLQ